MQTVAEIPASRKPTAFYATLHGLSGVITKPGAAVLFLEPESGAVVTITQADAPHLVVLGEVADSMAQYVADMAQYVADMARGGYATIACARAN